MQWWLSHKQTMDDSPPIKSVPRFAADFRAWYTTLQPETRGEEWPLKCVSDGDQWSAMMHGGRYGVITIVVALLWWWEAVKTDDGKCEVEQAVGDLAWALGEIVRARGFGETNKRDADGIDVNKRPAKRSRA